MSRITIKKIKIASQSWKTEISIGKESKKCITVTGMELIRRREFIKRTAFTQSAEV
jgi:hypothetical protein